MGKSNAQRQENQVHKCRGQAKIEIPRSTRSTLLLIVRSCIFEAFPDCELYACDAMHRDSDQFTLCVGQLWLPPLLTMW